LAFDIILTVVMLLGMLLGWYSTNIGFMVGLSILLLTNYKSPKEQTGQIKKFAGDAMNMVTIIFSIGVLIGILDGTGMIKEMTNTLVAAVPSSLGAHLTFIVALISVPLTMVIGSDASYLVLVPLLGKVVAPFGGTMMGVSLAMMIGACVAANLCLVGPVPYLSLGLAGVEMKDNLKNNFLPVWGMGIVLAIIAAVIGIFAF
jgi:CitMHS family citrate-Mg2+:H+ or citrate-Ca2+:H+ symporter